jgi:hypothetical protein
MLIRAYYPNKNSRKKQLPWRIGRGAWLACRGLSFPSQVRQVAGFRLHDLKTVMFITAWNISMRWIVLFAWIKMVLLSPKWVLCCWCNSCNHSSLRAYVSLWWGGCYNQGNYVQHLSSDVCIKGPIAVHFKTSFDQFPRVLWMQRV